MTLFLQDAGVTRRDAMDALVEYLDQADGLEVAFEPTPQGRRLLATLGVTVKPKEEQCPSRP